MADLLDWRRDGYSWVYTLVNFVLFILGFVFWLQKPAEIDVIDIKMIDAPYLATFIHMYTVAGELPKTLSLQALGSYEIVTSSKANDGTSRFGLPTITDLKILDLFAEAGVKRQMKNHLFTGARAQEVFLASPLWTYRHNLHLFDPAHCSGAEIAQAIADNRDAGVNIATMTPTTTAAEIATFTVPQKCSLSYPTTANYYMCYQLVLLHKSIFAFYSLMAAILWCLSVGFYVARATKPEGVGRVGVVYMQRISLFFHAVVLGLLSVGISAGIPAIDDTNSICPNAQTGLLKLYEIFMAVFVGVVLVTLMQLTAEVHACIYPHHAPDQDTAESSSENKSSGTTETTEYNAGGMGAGVYSCNFPS